MTALTLITMFEIGFLTALLLDVSTTLYKTRKERKLKELATEVAALIKKGE